MDSRQDHYLVLDVAGVDMALPMSVVAEILPVTRLERQIPWPIVLAGFMNLRGRPLAVIDLARLLDPSRPATKPDLYSHVVRLTEGHGDADMALLADRVKDAGLIAEGISEVEESASANGAVSGNLLVHGQLIPVLDVGRLLLLEEQARLAEIAEALQTRRDASGDDAP